MKKVERLCSHLMEIKLQVRMVSLCYFSTIFWEIISKDVINATKEFFGSRKLLKELNSTFIVLIPKKPSAKRFGDFRPISLCNSIYKIFSKVLALRLQRVLSKIISPQ